MGELNTCDPVAVSEPITHADCQPLEMGLLRHGEPIGGRRYRGCGVDDPLSESGWRQMWSSVARSGSWDRIVTSPMRRAREFAEVYADRNGLRLQVMTDLREIGMGEWEGRRPMDVALSDPAGYAAYYADPLHGMPAGAEPLDLFYTRIIGVLNALEGPGRVLVVAHAGVVRAALAYALEGSLAAMMRVKVPYASLSRLSRNASGWCLHTEPGG